MSSQAFFESKDIDLLVSNLPACLGELLGMETAAAAVGRAENAAPLKLWFKLTCPFLGLLSETDFFRLGKPLAPTSSVQIGAKLRHPQCVFA